MPVLNSNVRRWTQVTPGIGAQAGQGAGLTTLPHWPWADEWELGQNPVFERFGGAFGGVHLPRGARIDTHDEPGGSMLLATTEANLDLLLPWITQGSFDGGGNLSYQTGTPFTYFTIAERDHPSGRDRRVIDALPTVAVLRSGTATDGILKLGIEYFGEDFDDDAAGALTFTQSGPVDQAKFHHHLNVATDLVTGSGIGAANITLRLPAGFFPWLHNDGFPLGRKEGELNITGAIEGLWSDASNALRQLTQNKDWNQLRFRWTSQATPAVVLTITLNDVVFLDGLSGGWSGRRYAPLRAQFTNFGVPIINMV